MEIIQLDEIDKNRIKKEIKTWLFLSIIFFGVIIFVLLFFGGISSFFYKMTGGAGKRLFFIFSGFLGMFILININTILKSIDLQIGKKIKITGVSYKLIEDKKQTFLLIENTKIKIELNKKMAEMLIVEQPLNLEYTRYSKTILFISNNEKNLLV